MLFCRAVNVLPNRVVGSIGQHIGEPIEEIARSRDTKFLASCAHDQLIKFWDISSIPDVRVNDYRCKKKKDRRLKALSDKAFDTGQNFFAGLLDTKEENDEEEDDKEDDDSDSGSDWKHKNVGLLVLSCLLTSWKLDWIIHSWNEYFFGVVLNHIQNHNSKYSSILCMYLNITSAFWYKFFCRLNC